MFAESKSIIVGIPDGSESAQSSLSAIGQRNIHKFLEQYWEIWGNKFGYDIKFKTASYMDLRKALNKKSIDVIAIGATDRVNKGILSSIPFAYSSGALYERLGDKIKGLPVALHVPAPLTPENFNRSQNIIFQSGNINDVLENIGSANYLFSWNNVLIEETLDTSPYSGDFVLSDEPVGVPLRAMTHGSAGSLMLDINRGIRSISPLVVEELWAEIGENRSNMDVVIGEYYQKLSIEQEMLLVDSPFLTYAYVEKGEEPYFIGDDFELKGYTIDVLNDITAQLGVTFVGKPYRSFQEALDAVTSGEVDLFPGIYRTDSRMLALDFSVDIDKASIAIISEKDYYAISDLKGLRIALVRGLHENDIVASILPSNPVIYLDTAEEAIEAVANGRADAFVGKLLNSIYLVDKHKYYSLNVHKALDVERELLPRLAVNKSSTGIAELLNHGIYSLGDNFQHELSQKWRNSLETNYRAYQSGRVYEQALMLGAIFTVIVLVGALFYRLQLNRRTKIQNSLEVALFEAKEAKREAEEMALAKSDFLARMSHEIRTPMNGVLGMAEALSFTKLDREQTDLLQTLNGSARNLMALLNDVLDFSKMDAGKLTLEKVSCEIDSLIAGVVGNFRHKAKAKGLKMVSRIDPQLNHSYSCDSTRLMQVLNNLVSNSVKFTEQGYVEITAQLIAQDYHTNQAGDVFDLISLQIRDSGIGIPKEKMRTLFDPFVQADGDITRRFGGTGLGLSISKEIVDSMGGEIKVSSVIDHGSLFNILLPVIRIESHKQEADLETTLAARSGDLSRLRVLFAEDNEVNRKVIGGQLRRLGVQFETAENGLIAYNKYQEDPAFDLVLSDCHMPEMDGFTLAGKISEQRVDGKPYLIAITADALSGAAKRCLSAGFDDYISKPCPLDILEAKLNNVAATKEGAESDEAVGTLLDHQQSFDPETEQPEDDLSWLAEFESVTPQPESMSNQDSEENTLNIAWVTEGVEDTQSTIDSPNIDLPQGVDWFESKTTNEGSMQSDLDVLLQTDVADASPAFEFGSADPLESLLAELEGISQESETESDTGLGEEFDLESYISDSTSDSMVNHDFTDVIPTIESAESAETTCFELPEHQPFNDAAVLTMSGDDAEIVKEILETFLDNYVNDVEELTDAFESNDLTWLKDVAHRIKGSALYLGAEALSQVSKDLEHACAEGVTEYAKERVTFIKQHLHVLADEISLYGETTAA